MKWFGYALCIVGILFVSKMLLADILMDEKLNTYEPTYIRKKAQTFEDLQRSEALNSKNLTTLRNNLEKYFVLAQEYPENIEKVKKHFIYMKDMYPNDLGVYISIFEIEKKLGFENECRFTLQKVKEMRPDIIEWHESFRDLGICL